MLGVCVCVCVRTFTGTFYYTPLQLMYSFCFQYISGNMAFSVKTLLLFQLMHTIIKNHKMLKQFKSYNTCSDMFQLTQEPSSGSSPVLS